MALLLADYRMPQMNGIEFLEAAMDLFPAARRVLLTAYADTDAAIDAINVVDLDHYLLKPWHPPEEKLYPVVDGLLEAWAATPDAASAEIRVVGHRWSAPSFKVRDFLARNLVPYRWLLSDDPEGAAAARRGRGRPRRTCRWWSRPRARRWSRPSEAELAAQVGPDGHAGVRLLRPGRDRRRARPGSARRCTARRRGCAPCWSSGGRPAVRPGRAAGSRTTWASRTASPARS